MAITLFNITDFGISQKPVCDFLSHIVSKLSQYMFWSNYHF